MVEELFDENSKNVIIAEFIDLVLFMFTFVLMFVGMNSFYSMFFIALTIHIYLFFLGQR